MQKGLLEFHCGDARSFLKSLSENSVHCCVTSPPYWGLRDYGLEPVAWGGDPCCEHDWGDGTSYEGHRGNRGQTPQAKWQANETYPQYVVTKHQNHGDDGTQGSTLQGGTATQAQTRFAPAVSTFCQRCGAIKCCLGLEPTVDWYVSNLVEVCREVWRVLRPDGIFWLNLGDSYAAVRGSGPQGSSGQRADRTFTAQTISKMSAGLKPKDLCGIPWRAALALQDAGWYLRSDIVWEKGSCMPESVRDRPTRSHEYVFMLTKQPKYYWDQDAIREPCVTADDPRNRRSYKPKRGAYDAGRPDGMTGTSGPSSWPEGGRNVRTVWKINPRPFKEAHFATFPPELPERCIRSSTSEYGCCVLCAAPYKRIVEKGAPLEEWKQACGANSAGGYNGQAQKNYEEAGAQNASETKARILAGMVERRTVGWQSTCKCLDTPDLKIVNAVARLLDPDYHGPVVPCTVLDPFSGSGTVGLVAKRLGRRAILADQNASYIEMARRRCGEVDDAPTATSSPSDRGVEPSVP